MLRLKYCTLFYYECISIPKNYIKNSCQKLKNQYDLIERTDIDSGEDYRITTLSMSYLIVVGINMQGLKSIGQF